MTAVDKYLLLKHPEGDAWSAVRAHEDGYWLEDIIAEHEYLRDQASYFFGDKEMAALTNIYNWSLVPNHSLLPIMHCPECDHDRPRYDVDYICHECRQEREH